LKVIKLALSVYVLYIIFIGSKYSNEYNSESDFENLKETNLHETNLHENRL